MNNREKRKWLRLLRAIVFTVCISISILLLLFSFSFFMGNISDSTILVSVLGVLVTALIGWQIYSVLGIDRRVLSAEKRIERMLSDIRDAQSVINRTTKSSEDYTSGINCLSVAMIEYIQTIINRKVTQSEHAKHYCSCYIVSIQGIRYFLESQKDDELLYSNICLCVQGLKLSSDILFSPQYIIDAKREFTSEDHKICNTHYKYIMKRRKPLGMDNIRKIEHIHNKRIELLKP